jgi:predicted transcriptional regulator
MSTKELALDMIRDLPEDASWQDIEERLHFVAAVERGREEVRQGRVVPHEEVRALLKEWISE